MVSSVLDALIGRVPFAPVMIVVDALLAVFFLWCAGRTVTQAVRVRDGWMGSTMMLGASKKRLEDSHDEFVARYRRGLTVQGWSFVVIGVSTLVLATAGVLDGTSGGFSYLLFGLPILAWGVVSLTSRRILDSPASASARR
jgi:hypothetical protein